MPDLVFAVHAALWAVAGSALIACRRRTIGLISFVIAAGFAGASLPIGESVWPLHRVAGVALAISAALHLLVAIPDGRLSTTGNRVIVMFGYLAAGATIGAIATDTLDPVLGLVALGVFATLAALPPSTSRYRRLRGATRQGMQWIGWGVTVSLGVAGTAIALRLLVGWPDELATVAGGATAIIPLALAAGASPRVATRIDRLLVHTVSVAGLTAVVFASYVAIVIGLGRVPSGTERTIIGLSMAAAAIAAIFYVPARERLAGLANRIVYGERHAPDEVLRTFGTRLSRAIPMDELLLQLAESLRKTFQLDSAEIWTGSDGVLERAVSDPERPSIRIVIGDKELPVVARAGVSGPAWIKIWLPAIAQGREESMIRIAPITHSGELLGLIVVERRDSNDPFGEENERVLAELARQVALALHNVQLDSALQASLDELKAQAEDLRRSRERVVAAGDAERRKIERNLHDGAQQHLVALKVKLRLAQAVAGDPDKVKETLEQLGADVQETIEVLRALSHGIFPKVLTDRGLVAALEAAANRAALPTTVEASGVDRHRPEVEAAVYFCCVEALQNAGKHAGDGATARIKIAQTDGRLEFEVADDGAGFDRSSKGAGAGFANMQDRLGAVGGRVQVESSTGGGTRVSGAIPLEAARG